MEDDIIISPIFPVLFIVFAVASITFMVTADLKLSIGLSFFSTMSLIILLKHLDSRAEKPSQSINADLQLRDGTQAKNVEFKTRAGLKSRIAAKLEKMYRRLTSSIHMIQRSIGTVQSYVKFILSIIAAVGVDFFPTARRTLARNASCIVSQTPSFLHFQKMP